MTTETQRAHRMVEVVDGAGREWLCPVGDLPAVAFAVDPDHGETLRQHPLSVSVDHHPCPYPDCPCDLDEVCNDALERLRG